MKRHFNPLTSANHEEQSAFEYLIGLGSSSTRKNYYSALEENIKELEVERNRYKWLFENALHGIFQADFNGTVLAANPAFAEICGYQIDRQILDSTFSLSSIFACQEEYQQFKQMLIEEKRVFRYLATLKQKSGGLIYVSMNALLKPNELGEVYEAFVLDISAYKQAQDELTQLNEELENRVTDRTQELTKLNEVLVNEISDRVKMQEELRLAKESAEQVNLSKDKYIAAASHDLLQPMSAARLLVSALSERALATEDMHLVDRVHLALEGAEELLNDLLYISKLDQDAVQPHLNAFSIQQLLANLNAEFQPIANSSGIQLTVRPSRFNVYSDARLLTRILRNFISNALRYTAKGRVLVGCRPKGGMLSIQVLDTGVGIPSDCIQGIFREFHQLHNQQRGSQKGVGLGLAIVDRLAKMLEHQAKVYSMLNKGSVFSVEVPIATEVSTMHPDIQPVFPANSLVGVCVLVLDNDETILASMEILLKQWGCVVYLAKDKYEAIELCKAELLRPDMILADFHLDRGQTGTDAVLAMRKCVGTDIPAAIVTADHSDESNELFKRLKIPMLNKPLKPGKLRALMSHLLKS